MYCIYELKLLLRQMNYLQQYVSFYEITVATGCKHSEDKKVWTFDI